MALSSVACWEQCGCAAGNPAQLPRNSQIKTRQTNRRRFSLCASSPATFSANTTPRGLRFSPSFFSCRCCRTFLKWWCAQFHARGCGAGGSSLTLPNLFKVTIPMQVLWGILVGPLSRLASDSEIIAMRASWGWASAILYAWHRSWPLGARCWGWGQLAATLAPRANQAIVEMEQLLETSQASQLRD